MTYVAAGDRYEKMPYRRCGRDVDQRPEDPGQPGDPGCHGHDRRHAGQGWQGIVVYRTVALVSRDVWERVQARLQANPVSAKVNTWTLTGIAFCAVCGAPMCSSGAVYHGKRYSYYGCVHSLRRDGECVARRVKADGLEAAISRELLALVGNVELTESKPVPGRDYTEDMRRVADQISHLYGEVALAAVSGRDVPADQETLQRAHAELARLAALEPVEAGVEPVKTGQTFRQRWETLDARAATSSCALPPSGGGQPG